MLVRVGREVGLAKGLARQIREEGVGNGITEGLEAVKGPDDFLGRAIDLDEEWISWPRVAIPDDEVAVGKQFEGRDPGESNARKVVLVQFLYNLLLGGDLDHAMSIPGADQGVAVG